MCSNSFPLFSFLYNMELVPQLFAKVSDQLFFCLFLVLGSHLWSIIKGSWISIYSISFKQLHSLFLLVFKLSHLWPKGFCSFGVCELLTPLFVINEFLGFVAQDISYLPSVYPAPDLGGWFIFLQFLLVRNYI